MKIKKIVTFIICIAVVGLATGCASIKVKRTDVDKTVDLSGNWNDTDARLVAEEMIKDCLARSWVNNFSAKYGKQPVVIVGTVINRSSEHINAQVFITDLEQNLINSQRVKFVAAKQERQEIREEREDQRINSSRETVKPSGEESGADFMLQGSINSVKDEIKGKYAIFYQVNLELVDMMTNEKAWIGQKEIKKVVSRSSFSF